MKISGTPEEIMELAKQLAGARPYEAGKDGRKWQPRPQAPAAPKRDIPEYRSALDLLDAIGISKLDCRQAYGEEDGGAVWLVSQQERLPDTEFSKLGDYGRKNAIRFDKSGACWVFRRVPEAAPVIPPKEASK